MSTKSKKPLHLTTLECVVAPREHAELVTPGAQADFEIASMTTGDNELRFVSLQALVRETSSLRTIYQSTGPADCEPDEEEPSADSDLVLRTVLPGPKPPGEEFDDFMMSLISPPEHQDDTPKRPRVRRGEALLLDVFNPTAEPITVKVKFSGPEVE